MENEIQAFIGQLECAAALTSERPVAVGERNRTVVNLYLSGESHSEGHPDLHPVQRQVELAHFALLVLHRRSRCRTDRRLRSSSVCKLLTFDVLP